MVGVPRVGVLCPLPPALDRVKSPPPHGIPWRQDNLYHSTLYITVDHNHWTLVIIGTIYWRNLSDFNFSMCAEAGNDTARVYLRNKACFCVCCGITSKVEKCCLKWKSRGISQSFCISNNILTLRRLFCNNHENKYFIPILPQYKIKLSFSSIKEWSRSICDTILTQNWRESCSLLYPRDLKNTDNWLSFLNAIGL